MSESIALNQDNETIRVFIVRHGQTDHNVAKILQGHLDTSLNSVGEEQAQLIADRFKGFHFDSIYSSDLTRCKQTLKAILEKLDSPSDVKYTKLLRERHMGIIEGKQLQDAIAYAEKEGKHYRDYGEDAHEFVSRIAKALNDILIENKNNKNVLLVSHGGTIRTILKILKYNKDLIVYNTSVTVIDFNRKDLNKFKIKTIGDTGHLGEGVFKVDSRVR